MGDVEKSASPFPYSDAFDKQCPYYLAMGMSYDDYWNGDSQMVKFYREADQLKLERTNMELWLQGMYIYDALDRIAPIYQAFAKKGSKAKPYTERPYPLTDGQKEQNEKSEHRESINKSKAFMDMLMVSTNKRFKGE